jgi:hypothetical protein
MSNCLAATSCRTTARRHLKQAYHGCRAATPGRRSHSSRWPAEGGTASPRRAACDSNGNGRIELSELAAHIQALAPRLSRDLRGSGVAVAEKARGFALADGAIATRLADFRQKPRLGSRGEDFPLVMRLSTLPGSDLAQ